MRLPHTYDMLWRSVMPLMLGMSNMVFQIGETQWMSLMGHVIYGVITGLRFIAVGQMMKKALFTPNCRRRSQPELRQTGRTTAFL